MLMPAIVAAGELRVWTEIGRIAMMMMMTVMMIMMMMNEFDIVTYKYQVWDPVCLLLQGWWVYLGNQWLR